MFRQILRNSFTIGTATFISRVLGFIRDILIAFFFGTGYEAQAFVVAFRLPNIWRSFVGEEAVNAAVVPVLSEYRAKEDSDNFKGLSKSLIKSSAFMLTLVTIGGIFFAPLLIKLIAPGFIADIQKYVLSVRLTRVIFPYVLLIGLTAIVAGIAMSQRIFWSYSWAPAVLNISIISSILVLGRRYGVYALAFGIIIGGVIQLLMQFFAIRGKGVYRAKTRMFHPEYGRIWKLLLPRFLGAGVYQVSIFIDTILASLQSIVGSGAIAALYYAQRFVQLPLAVFATSLATAVLPFFSARRTKNENASIGDNLLLSLRFVSFIMIPATFGFFILAKEIISVVFQHGSFSSYSTAITSGALRFYALGLLFYAGIKILVVTFYSMQDTLTPVKISVISLAVNIAASIALMFPMKVSGLCLATSFAASCNFILLFLALNKKIKFYNKNFVSGILKILLCSVIMAGALLFTKRLFLENISSDILVLISLILISIFVYLFSSLFINSEDLRRFIWSGKKR
ncbi:MAG: murein biosynthesis integral membrane protein MurJ [Candidatus Kaelpia imicola]|nr:murein biosynthesis integral membrane protein MurJ [Candidatus Kaelpia imicola]